MLQAASRKKSSVVESSLNVAFELGWTKWKLAFGARVGEKPWHTTIGARDIRALREAIGRARKKLGLSETSLVVSCYEAGRDGFWLDRLLSQMGVMNVVVDSSSIDVNRRARRAKSDRLDATKLLAMLMRYRGGERGVWSVVRPPTPEQEDARHLQREIRTLKKEKTRLVNRVRGLLASQGVAAKMGRRGLVVPLSSLRIWDGSAVPEGLKRRIEYEMARHEVVHRQVLELEGERDRRIREENSEPCQKARQLMQLKAVGEASAETLSREFLYRQFRNRRQIGGLSGLSPTPYQSGDSSKERGISRAGNRHVRGIAVDLAWGWLHHQPQSKLSRWYEERFGKGGPRMRKIGIVALARKLLIALWRYAEFGEMPEGALLKQQAA
jgi:transposase